MRSEKKMISSGDRSPRHCPWNPLQIGLDQHCFWDMEDLTELLFTNAEHFRKIAGVSLFASIRSTK